MTRTPTAERPSVDAALSKVDRAREHIEALDEATLHYVEESGALEFYAEPAPEGAVIAKVRVHEAPPVRLALICGDAIHNLRSALDYLVWQLGIADSGAVSDQSAFPIVLEEAKWPSVAGRTLALLKPDHVEAIRLLQPFVDRTDNSPHVIIGMLGAMANRDKHRLPLVVAAAAFKGQLSLEPGATRVHVSSKHTGPIQLDGDVELFRLAAGSVPGGKLDIKAAVHVGVSFAGPRGPTTKNLRQLADTVAGIIGSFAVDIALANP